MAVGTFSNFNCRSHSGRSKIFRIRPTRYGPKIRQSTIYYSGLLGRWDKQIVDQESDVPSIIFLYFS